MKKKRVKKFFFFCIIFPIILFSQEQDFQIWNNVELQYESNEKTQFSLENGIRFGEDARILLKCFLDFNVKKEYSDLISYSAGYRYIFKRNDDDMIFEKKHRFYADTYFRKSLSSRIKCSFRTRLQTQIDSEFAIVQDITHKLRQKIKLTYDIRKTNLDFFLAFEVFYIFNDGIEKLRYVTGLEKPLTKKMDFNINYMVQQDFNNIVNDLWFVVRAKISYQI